jgi:hypothetical protein
MVCGLEAISYYLPNTKQYILTDSYRLTQNSVDATNSFYSGMLKSKSEAQLPLNFSLFPLLKNTFQENGGTSLKMFELSDGRIPSSECTKFIIELINELKQYNAKTEIALLAFNRDTVRFLQKEVYSKCSNTEDILVETIDRIQGLTTDFCIFLIPTESIPFALQANRFNVATSRAKLSTVIITDENINSFYPHINNDVKNYLKLTMQVFSSGHHKTTPRNDITKIETNDKEGIKVLGKIDLSQFEKTKKEIKKDKENIYIIDTNVFIDCPDIISKIDKQYQVVLSAKVIDELDKLKVTLPTNEQKQNVQKAIKQINNSFDKRNIKMITADITLLPNDFDKKSPDNFILTVALKYKDENPIMLTSDNGLQLKSKGFGITTISLKDFLKQIKY